MRLYHPENGFHFESSAPEIERLKTLGWLEAPKGFQKTLKGEVEQEPVKTLGLPQRGRPRSNQG